MNTPDATPENQQLIRVGENLYRSSSSSIYYAILKKNGKQIRRSLKTTDRELAKRRLADFRARYASLATNEDRSLLFATYEKDAQTGTETLVGGLAKLWLDTHLPALKPKSRLMYFNSVKMLTPYFRGMTIRNLGLKEVQAWASQRTRLVSPRTFNADLQTLQQILKYGTDHGYLLDNPALRIHRRKLDRHSIEIPTREQFRKLLASMRSNAGKRDASASADLIEFLGYSGCRISEAVGEDIDPQEVKPPMYWGAIDFKAGTFTVKDTKNHEARVVPLFPPLRRLLEEMRDRLPERPNPNEPIFQIKTCYRALSTAARNLGLPHFGHHAFRHFFCSNAIEAGIDFKAISAWLGHKDGGVLVARTYGHLRDEHSTAMAQRMTFDAITESPTVPATK